MLFALTQKNSVSDEALDLDDRHSNFSNKRDTVSIRFGDHTHQFYVKQLQQLPYFEALLSKRWDGNNDKVIQVMKQVQGFGLDDFKLLLKCIELKYIPNDVSLNLQEIESLLNCCDFFCMVQSNDDDNKNNNQLQDIVIDEKKLIKYFQVRKPLITAKERENWLVESNSKLIRRALIQYNKLLEKQLSRAAMKRGRKSSDKVQRPVPSTEIEYDNETAASLFDSHFNILIKIEDNYNDDDDECSKGVSIDIVNYDDILFDHLYGLFDIKDYWCYLETSSRNVNSTLEILNDCEYHCSFANGILRIIKLWCQWHPINTFCSKNNIQTEIRYGDEDDEEPIKNSINQVMDDILTYLSSDIDACGKKGNLDIFAVLLARLNSSHYTGYLVRDLNGAYGGFTQRLKPNEMQTLMENIADSYKLYKNLKDEEDWEILTNWYKFFQSVLKGCNEKFIANDTQLWFPIVCDAINNFDKSISKEEWNKFVFDEIIVKFGTQSAFDFGLYLVDFIIYRQENQDHANLDQRYFTFLQKSVGINWNLSCNLH